MLSIFDIVGSCAYALTTLPIPEDDLIPIYGANGTDATCTGKVLTIVAYRLARYVICCS